MMSVKKSNMSTLILRSILVFLLGRKLQVKPESDGPNTKKH